MLSGRPQEDERPPYVGPVARPQHPTAMATTIPVATPVAVAATANPVEMSPYAQPGRPGPVHATAVSYAQPVQPAYAQPAYAQPAYQQPAYGQPGYVGAGGYQPPAYQPSAPHGGGPHYGQGQQYHGQHHGGGGGGGGGFGGAALAGAGVAGLALGGLAGYAAGGGFSSDSPRHDGGGYHGGHGGGGFGGGAYATYGHHEAAAYGGMRAGAGRDDPPDAEDDGAAIGVLAGPHKAAPARCEAEPCKSKLPKASILKTQRLASQFREELDFITFDAHVWAPQNLQARCIDDNTNSITIVTQCSLDRLPRLAAMAEAWSGKISCAVRVPSGADAAAAALQTIEQMYTETADKRAAELSLVLYQEPLEEVGEINERTRWAKELYPINALRNAALCAARTEYVWLLDIDFVPSAGASQALLQLAEAELGAREALVVPALEVNADAEMPVTKADVQQLVQNGKAEGFHVTRYPKGHRATNFERWLHAGAGEEYEVEYELGFEPYVICRRAEVPQYDARFRGYGLNKVVHLLRMATVFNFKFKVATTGHFVAAMEHDSSVDYRKTYGPSRDPLQVARIQALFDIARDEMGVEIDAAKNISELSLIASASSLPASATRDVIFMRLAFVVAFIGHSMCFALAAVMEASRVQHEQWLKKHHARLGSFAKPILNCQGDALLAATREKQDQPSIVPSREVW